MKILWKKRYITMHDVGKLVNIVWKKRCITMHDVIGEMSIYISKKEEIYLFLLCQLLKYFPHPHTLPQCCERIWLFCNQIESPPNDFLCQKLVSLNLCRNLCSIKLFFNLTSIMVLYLSIIHIELVPTSLTQHAILEFLDLNSTYIKELPHFLAFWISHGADI